MQRRPGDRHGSAAASRATATSRARDLLAREVGYVRKPHGGRLRVALCFPNTLLRRDVQPRTADRLPALQRRRARGLRARVPAAASRNSRPSLARRDPLVTIESQTPVRDFDVFAFSVSFEWDYPNVVTMLRLAGLEPRADRRHRARSAHRDRRRRDVRQSRAARAVCRRDRGRRSRAARARARRGVRGRGQPRIASGSLNRLAPSARLLRAVPLRRARTTGPAGSPRSRRSRDRTRRRSCHKAAVQGRRSPRPARARASSRPTPNSDRAC